MSPPDTSTMHAAVVGDDLRIGLRTAPRRAARAKSTLPSTRAVSAAATSASIMRDLAGRLDPGHEITGRIDAIGDRPPPLVEERGLQVGQRVVSSPSELRPL